MIVPEMWLFLAIIIEMRNIYLNLWSTGRLWNNFIHTHVELYIVVLRVMIYVVRADDIRRV
jgi:hypothetical protein